MKSSKFELYSRCPSGCERLKHFFVDAATGRSVVNNGYRLPFSSAVPKSVYSITHTRIAEIGD